LLAFSAFPAEHWAHLRTTNPIASSFATVRHRTKIPPCTTFLGLALTRAEEAAKTWQRMRAQRRWRRRIVMATARESNE
jgi:transposase-like protein